MLVYYFCCTTCLIIILFCPSNAQQSQERNNATRNTFLCEPFYGKTFKTIKSVRNESIRLSVLKLQPSMSLSFNEAQEICRKCIDGALVIQDDVTQLIDFLPTWIGIHSKPGTIPNSDDYIWLDGSIVNRWQRNFASTFHQPNSFMQDQEYGVYAIKSSSSPLNMDWISVAKMMNSSSVQTLGLGGSFSRSYNLGYHNVAHQKMEFIVCERLLRNNCYYWNYTEDACVNEPNFGCHNYINAMYSESDQTSIALANLTCKPPQHRRHAFKCPCSSCSCNVTQWGEWSSCGREICRVEPMERSRKREQIDTACPESYHHFELMEYEVCRIPGCDDLRTALENCSLTQ